MNELDNKKNNLLVEIKLLIKSILIILIGYKKEKSNWGSIANLTHVRDLLSEINDFLTVRK